MPWKNPEWDKAWRLKNKDKISKRKRNSNLIKNYGITTEKYNEMFKNQDGLCAICYKAETLTYKGTLKHLCVDHDHNTGKVRALLCNCCNIGIENLKENEELLLNAINYLKKHKGE